MCDFHSKESILLMIVWGFGVLTNKEKILLVQPDVNVGAVLSLAQRFAHMPL